ncbi:LysR substrate-binding domain-containing protein [Alteromonas sp. ASW11-36]|uniref:LysR substrate-binding domain-containing protein n=1 Tax=Alteromonas arenosi TaxID=3055817 RepID=A0ABT7T0D5_9ALTE|nr:hydrogen peroxide-inducible genes activator [Alteromonas sp. ASW11-36]MDM7861870.1 LysR substrate-binding domain-containing protein [Alteromonas sp. ASW11-36]
MKWPNLKHLHYLVVLHQEQHFHRAAERCHVTQSTLSSAIQNLEEHFGAQLLEREHKAFVFSAFGLEIVERSKRIINEARELVDFACNAGDWRSGTLKLGVIPTIAPFLFEGLIKSVNRLYPSLSLHLQEDTTENLLEQLNEGDLDLLVLALPMETPGCKQLVIGHDPFHLVMHRSTYESTEMPLDVTSLPKNSIFLLQQEHCMTGHAVSACNLRYSEQVNSLAASSLHTLVQLANAKLGYTFIPELALQQDILEKSDLISLPAEDNAFREIGLVWRNGTTRVQLFRSLAECLAPLMPVDALKR